MLQEQSTIVTAESVSTRTFGVSIYTLGHFEVLVEGVPLRFARKVQKRPLELLKLLVAMGGYHVSMDTLGEKLWPEADGDALHINFNTTLHRLRKLIGAETVRVKHSLVTLDKAICWTDLWELEQILSQLESMVVQPLPAAQALCDVLEQAAYLYRGPFLCNEADRPWSMSPRDRLQHRWQMVLHGAIAALGGAKHCDLASLWLERALEYFPINEAFYRGYIACLAQQGRRAEAINMYQRCCRVLQEQLQLEPSIQTHNLYQEIKHNLIPAQSQDCEFCKPVLSKLYTPELRSSSHVSFNG
ncbi:MAG: hypothetical protein HY080_17085 [Gammaproteobacteria bacterium]|nr:hypothetical protein [Gammaproteobacteria bacterium]